MYVLGTAKRPIPLNHFLYSDHTMSLLMDGAAVDVGDNYGWKTANYKAAAAKLELRTEKKGGAASFGPQRNFRAGNSGGGTDKGQKQVWSNLINTLTTKDLLPSIIFCFSKKKCEECAFFGLSSVDLNTAKEKAAVHLFIDAAVRRLSGTDRTLPQIMRLRSLLRRGIGVHHSGLLPIMKETVELLFARGLVKVRRAGELARSPHPMPSTHSPPGCRWPPHRTLAGALCDGDVRDGHQHARPQRRLQRHPQARRHEVPVPDAW